MSLFGPRFYTPEPSFSGLFRLIDEFDKYAAQTGVDEGQRGSHRLQTFQPKFDLKETETAYELHGELPGVEKENVNIEFTDPQTIVIRGKIERSYTSGTPPTQIAGPRMSGELNEGEEPVVVDHQESNQPNVEDEKEEGGAVTENKKSTAVSKSTQDSAPKAKYWVSERSIGEFQRAFSFPTNIDADAVQASLKKGVLEMTVPKAKKPATRRVNIN